MTIRAFFAEYRRAGQVKHKTTGLLMSRRFFVCLGRVELIVFVLNGESDRRSATANAAALRMCQFFVGRGPALQPILSKPVFGSDLESVIGCGVATYTMTIMG
jgi:hypothetical protein